MGKYQDFHKRSIENRDDFWAEQAQLVEWKEPFTQVCDYSRPPFVKWFVNGKTNLCYNAVDRHAAERPNDRALIFVSTETDEERIYTWAELQREVERMAAILQSQGVGVSLKHFAGNNQETRRMTTTSAIDERALASIFQRFKNTLLKFKSGESINRGSVSGSTSPTVAGLMSARFSKSRPSRIEAANTRR